MWYSIVLYMSTKGAYKLGDSATQDVGYNILINFSSISKIGMGVEFGPPCESSDMGQFH